MKFESGIVKYVECAAKVKQYFPVDDKGKTHAYCDLCRYFGRSARMCRLTDERIVFPECRVGDRCPLEYDESEGK